ncbi:DUF6702 family protein [Hymenobacter nivis]|uniref:Uncharacterized protein n=1 Tax=Hymenobacter nivis TaxID=1850093 RepID=A0A2Z3GQH7_9BACT|nr:DUF6702 family protein [Hymenobacter nivis]AWM33275.1 hypothetical protein DDQ68_11075 [Hymenobacter nivis]
MLSFAPLLGLVLTLLAPPAPSSPKLHAYHASITELRYNAAKQQLELATKVFTDDFEKGLSEGRPAHVDLQTAGPTGALIAADYLRRTLVLHTPAGAPLPLQFIGMQPEKDSYWLYCKAAVPGKTTGVQVRNSLLLDSFADQMNIVNLEANGKKSSALLRQGHEQETLSW